MPYKFYRLQEITYFLSGYYCSYCNIGQGIDTQPLAGFKAKWSSTNALWSAEDIELTFGETETEDPSLPAGTVSFDSLTEITGLSTSFEDGAAFGASDNVESVNYI